MSERLHLCVYKYARPSLVISEELDARVYELTHNSIGDFEPNDEELWETLEKIGESDDEAKDLLSVLKSNARSADLCQFEFY